MAPRIGYLLPTRESVMEGRPDAAPLLALAERAEKLGYDSVWVGDSLLARPRHLDHEPAIGHQRRKCRQNGEPHRNLLQNHPENDHQIVIE